MVDFALLLPLLAGLAVLSPLVLSPVSHRVDLLVSRLAVAAFGRHVANRSARRPDQVSLLRAARVESSHRVYASRTLLFATFAATAGVFLGVYPVLGFVGLLDLGAETLRETLPEWLSFVTAVAGIPSPTTQGVFWLMVGSSAALAAVAGVGTYAVRWRLLEQRAVARATAIEATLPRTVAFVYALSRSGMSFPEVLLTLTRNEDVYGEAARDIGVAAREMDTFGTEVVAALQRMGSYTPSESLEEFADNLASVLGSGRSLSSFLHEQYERYQSEARAQQEQYLDLLSTFAEVYVTALVAGPLFLITILVIIGLTIRDTLGLVRIIGYVGIPLATAGFVVYIDSMTETLPTRREMAGRQARGDHSDPRRAGEFVPDAVVADGGQSTRAWAADAAVRDRANLERLSLSEHFARFRAWIEDPISTVRAEPAATFAVTVPVALGWVVLRSAPIPLGIEAIEAIDSPLVEGTVLMLATYALVHEVRNREARRMERAVPDFLDRMASVNEAGLTVVESLSRVNRGDLGALGPEVDRTWRDIQWGADAGTALRRLDARTRTAGISQAVTLITNAMQASGDLAPVLRIAADEAQENRRLRLERRREMLTYLVVIYMSFLVFLGIVVALSLFFLPAIEAAAPPGSAGGAASGAAGTTEASGLGSQAAQGPTASVGDVDVSAYETLFFHLAAVQAVCSGLVAGQLGEGSIRDGAKHAAVLLAVAYGVFLVV